MRDSTREGSSRKYVAAGIPSTTDWARPASTTSPWIHTARVCVYAAAHTGLFKTTDGGQNWRRVLDPRRHWDPASRRFGADAVTVAGPTTVYATISRGGRWFLWKSVDRGASWRRLARNTLSTGDGLWKNVDRGASSRQLGRSTLLTGDGHPLAAGASDPETVYVAGRSGLATSTDGGATWHDAGLAGTRITAIAVHPQLADTVYAGTAAGLFTSTNAGQTWQRVGDDLAQAHVTAVATDPEQGGRVYAATDERGLLERGQRRELESVRHPAPPTNLQRARGHAHWHDLRRLIQRRRHRPATDIGAGPTALNTSTRKDALLHANGGPQLINHGRLR